MEMEMGHYVEWANTLDSAGKDSSAVRARCALFIIDAMDTIMYDAIKALMQIDHLKKFLFYGKELPEDFHWPDFMSDARHEAHAKLQDHETIRLLHGIFGKADEAGELMQALHKHLFYGGDLDRTNIVEEVGDSQWYDALIAKWAGIMSFVPIQLANYKKLTTRYPDKVWSQSGALDRDLDKERAALEQDSTPHVNDI